MTLMADMARESELGVRSLMQVVFLIVILNRSDLVLY
jgi:hypothetical protein